MSNPFLRAYEFEKKYGVDRLKLTLEKAEQAYKTHEPETIDFCKSALECVCKSILAEKGDTAHTGIQDVPKLIKATLRVLGHPNEQIGGGISSLAKGIAQIRNDHTIAGHGMDASTSMLTKTEIAIFVKTFAHTVDVILTLLDAQEIDISTTRMTFDAVEAQLNLTAANEEIDGSVSVEYSAEDGVIFVDGKELRPSEVLFHFDRMGYNQRIERAKEARQARLEESFREMLSESLYGRFDGFYPGHYGVDDLEIIFDQINVSGTAAVITGNIYASARLGASRAEDGMDVDYASGFKAEFQCYNEDDPDAFELEKLELEIVDWVQHEEFEDDIEPTFAQKV